MSGGRDPGSANLVAMLQHSADSAGDRTALIFTDGQAEEARISYAELEARARSIAVRIAEVVEPGERVLLLYPPGIEFVCGLFGCVFAGAIAVPVYPPEPRRLQRTLPRIASMLQDCAAGALVTLDAVCRASEAMIEVAPQLKGREWIATDSVDSTQSDSWRARRTPSADAIAIIQYTSGSTAEPKGVMLSHRNLTLMVDECLERMSLRSDDRAVFWLPPYHDMGLIGGVLAPLRGRLEGTVLMSPMSFLQRPARWVSAMSRYRGTVSGAPDFGFELAASRTPPEEREALDLRAWRVAFTGAEPIRADTLDRFCEAFGPCGFRREALYPCYGLAEATLMVSGSRPGEAPTVGRFHRAALEQGEVRASDAEDDEARVLVGCGFAIPDGDLRIVDPERGIECAAGEVGEVWFSSPTVGAGYWGRPTESEASFRARLSGSDRTFVRSGDLGFLEGGELFICGRLKDVLIIRGRNLDAHDVEDVVVRSHPALRGGGTAVFCVDEGVERMVIVQEIRSDDAACSDEAVAAIRAAVIDSFRVQPHAVVLVGPRVVEKTSSGKVRRFQCRSQYLAGALPAIKRWSAESPA